MSTPFVCDVCLKPFDRKAGLAQHQKRKTPCKAAVATVATVATNQVVNPQQLVPAVPTPPPFRPYKTAISLFSGCGGDTLGLTQAGYHVRAFSELKPTMIKTHLANFPDSELITSVDGKQTNISKIEDSQFAKYRDQINLIFAGFPCQGFSKAGKKQATDPRNQMYLQFVRAAKQIRPLYIVGENVQGLESMKSGPEPTDPPMLNLIKAAFEEIGYTITYEVLEATQFGVPQKRKRILLVGWDTAKVTAFKPVAFWNRVDNIKEPLPKISSFIQPSLDNAHPLATTTVPADFQHHAVRVPLDTPVTGKPHPYVVLKANEGLLSCAKRDSPIHSEVMDLTAPSKTIICTYGHQPRLLVGLQRGSESFVRTLTPDELKQIQGFPADYKLLGTVSEQVIQVGNAVPPPMIKAIVESLPH